MAVERMAGSASRTWRAPPMSLAASLSRPLFSRAMLGRASGWPGSDWLCKSGIGIADVSCTSPLPPIAMPGISTSVAPRSAKR
ncbi:hypothetical protein AJ88_28985 [Mesorhizobium amorphae CCBAU 01583]|nr:hypothetical protein AJ88_28985 [Mesorhizobium amorphae CCBAU 01583]